MSVRSLALALQSSAMCRHHLAFLLGKSCLNNPRLPASVQFLLRPSRRVFSSAARPQSTGPKIAGNPKNTHQKPRRVRPPSSVGEIPSSDESLSNQRHRPLKSEEGTKEDPELTQQIINEKVARFRIVLERPDHTLITGFRAQRKYSLSPDMLKGLKSHQKANPYSETAEDFRQYWLPDVVHLATTNFGKDHLIERYRAYLESGQASQDAVKTIYGFTKEKRERYAQEQAGKSEKPGFSLSTLPSKLYDQIISHRASHHSIPHKVDGMTAVKQSLFTNLGIGVTKTCVWFASGSASMFTDCMHSVADIINAGYRYYGIATTTAEADYLQPYGYERRRFVVADRSAFVVLIIGSMIPLVHGWHDLWRPYEVTMPFITIAVFLIAAGLESLQVKKAYLEMRAQGKSKNMTFWQYFAKGQDTISISTFIEASVGMVGAVVGTSGILLSMYFSTGFYDALASMIIASMIGMSSMFIMKKNESQLLGATLPVSTTVKLISRLQDDEVVTTVHDVKTEVYGVRSVRFKAEIQFNAEAITRRHRNLTSVPCPATAQLVEELRGVVSIVRDERAPPPPPIASSSPSEGSEKVLAPAVADAGVYSSPFWTMNTPEERAEDWLMRNNALFLQALCAEIKRLESIISKDLQDLGYRKIHIDLEPW